MADVIFTSELNYINKNKMKKNTRNPLNHKFSRPIYKNSKGALTEFFIPEISLSSTGPEYL